MLKNALSSSIIVLAGGLFATTGLANTGEDSKHGHDMSKEQNVSFEQLDQNGDNYISQSEFQSSSLQQVEHDTLDTDNDGRINQTEFAAFEQMSQDQSHSERWQTNPEHQTDDTFRSTEPTSDPDPTQNDY